MVSIILDTSYHSGVSSSVHFGSVGMQDILASFSREWEEMETHLSSILIFSLWYYIWFFSL